MTDLSWYLWTVFGFGGSVYLFIWTLFSKPKDPIMRDPLIAKLGWISFSFLLFYVGLDNLEKGGFMIPYKEEMDKIVKPVLLVWWVLFWSGLYQKITRPGYPIDKRILGTKCLVIATIVTIILLAMVKYT